MQTFRIQPECLHSNKTTTSTQRDISVFDLTIGMLGPAKHPELKAKAAETVGMLGFVVHLLEKHANALPHGAADLLDSARAAVAVNTLIKESGRVMTPDQRRGLMQHYVRHAKLYFKAGGKPTPKHHLCLHLFVSMATRGNPKYYHTYRDETLNGLIAKLCAAVHRFVFHTEVHRRFANLQQLCRGRLVPASVAGCTL